jgi:hypothetical protein
LNQVHKETLNQVENALPNRQGLEVEIFGMEGIPQDSLEQHRNRIIQNFYQAQEDRRIATGNPASGQAMPRKKLRMESTEDLMKRLAEFRAHKQAGTLPPAPEEPKAAPAAEQVRKGKKDKKLADHVSRFPNILSRYMHSRASHNLRTPANNTDTPPIHYLLDRPATHPEPRGCLSDRRPRQDTGRSRARATTLIS